MEGFGERLVIAESVRPDPSDLALLETLVLEAPVAFALYDVDLRYRRINRALAEINQLPMALHVGRRPSEILEPDLGAAIEAMLLRVLESGDVIAASDFSREVPPGSGVVRHWQSSWYPARDATGQTIGVAVFVTDVTERRRIESALRKSQERSSRLQQATAELATALAVEDVVRVISEVGRRAVGADRSTVALVDDDVLRIPERREPTLAALAVERGTPLYLASRAELERVGPQPPGPVVDADEHAWAVLPLTTAGRAIGALLVSFLRERVLDRDERGFLEALAGQCAIAVERARLYAREQRVAEVLQRELLPDRLPDVPGLHLAARYFPGSDEAEVGGDWYDAFQLLDGRVAIVLGDVMGRGTTAAAGMGRVRSAIRALALTDPAPAAVLTGLDRVFTALEPEDRITTVVYAAVDPLTGAVDIGDAGHLPVLLLGHDGAAELFDAGPATTPLGVAEPRTQRCLVLEPGDTLVAFSDGLVEDRRHDLGAALSALLDAVSGHEDLPLGELLDRAVVRLVEGRSRDDDVTVLAIRRTPST